MTAHDIEELCAQGLPPELVAFHVMSPSGEIRSEKNLSEILRHAKKRLLVERALEVHRRNVIEKQQKSYSPYFQTLQDILKMDPQAQHL